MVEDTLSVPEHLEMIAAKVATMSETSVASFTCWFCQASAYHCSENPSHCEGLAPELKE